MTQTHEQPIAELAPRDDEVFLSQNPVEDVRVLAHKKHRGGDEYKQEISMQNGLRYIVHSAEPHERITDVPMMMPHPWFTRNKGLNRRMMYHVAKQGIPIDVISVEQNLMHIPHFGQTAHNQLEISHATSELYDRDDENLYVNGVSRGAMLGFATNAFAKKHGKNVLSSDLIVPCYPEVINPIRDARDYASMPLREAKGLAALGSLPLRVLRHYPETFDANPKQVFQHLKSIPTLTSGAAGTAAGMMPADTRGHVSVFKGDIMSQAEKWQEILEPFPDITFEIIDQGSHLDCASDKVYSDWVRRIDALAHDIRSQSALGVSALNAG